MSPSPRRTSRSSRFGSVWSGRATVAALSGWCTSDSTRPRSLMWLRGLSTDCVVYFDSLVVIWWDFNCNIRYYNLIIIIIIGLCLYLCTFTVGQQVGTYSPLINIFEFVRFKFHFFFHIRAFRHIRAALTQEMANSVAVFLVTSRLDYANSLLFGTSQANLNKLQRIQNTLAKLVDPSHTRSSDALHTLHWLPVRQCINFKIATLTFKLLQHSSPAYLASLIQPYVPSRALLTWTATLSTATCQN